MTRYSVRYVHKIAPSEKDVSEFTLPDGAPSDRNTLAKALRKAGALQSGERLREFRVEGDKTLAFPDRGIWHCLVLTEVKL